ncbi:hypothetical protein C8T65DRAFT_668268 [Cerioporus squamosus]|nr:hypothetical protein C8T65DRAFT_668268 [Cerioporus squamosus]
MPPHLCAACPKWVQSPERKFCETCEDVSPRTDVIPLNRYPGYEAITRLHWPHEIPATRTVAVTPTADGSQTQPLLPPTHDQPQALVPPCLQAHERAVQRMRSAAGPSALAATSQTGAPQAVAAGKNPGGAGQTGVLVPAGHPYACTQNASFAQPGPSCAVGHVVVSVGPVPPPAAAVATTRRSRRGGDRAKQELLSTRTYNLRSRKPRP